MVQWNMQRRRLEPAPQQNRAQPRMQQTRFLNGRQITQPRRMGPQARMAQQRGAWVNGVGVRQTSSGNGIRTYRTNYSRASSRKQIISRPPVPQWRATVPRRESITVRTSYQQAGVPRVQPNRAQVQPAQSGGRFATPGNQQATPQQRQTLWGSLTAPGGLLDPNANPQPQASLKSPGLIRKGFTWARRLDSRK